MTTPTFQYELTKLINRHSLENESDTPDFALAEYLVGCLQSYNRVQTARTKFYINEEEFPSVFPITILKDYEKPTEDPLTVLKDKIFKLSGSLEKSPTKAYHDEILYEIQQLEKQVRIINFDKDKLN